MMRPNGNGHNRDAATSRVAVTRAADAAQPVDSGGIQLSSGVNTGGTPPLLVTIPKTSELISLSRATVYRLIQSGELTTVHQGRAVRVTYASIARWVAERSGEPAALPTPECGGTVESSSTVPTDGRAA